MGGSEQEMLRAARNQTLYREVNERIEGLNEAFADTLDLDGAWVCECADENCAEPMEMTLDEYERVRAHPNHFAVLHGHVYPRSRTSWRNASATSSSQSSAQAP